MSSPTNNPWDEFDETIPKNEKKIDIPDSVKESGIVKSITKTNEEVGVVADEVIEVFKNTPSYPRPDFKNKRPYMENILILSASLIKQVIDKYDQEVKACPYQLFRYYIIGDVSTLASENMIRGSFFETLILGGGLRGKELWDLPRKIKDGSKMADQRKIEKQALYFKQIATAHGLEIKKNWNTQVKIYKQLSSNIFLVGDLDIFPAIFEWTDGPFAGIIDTKLTMNIFSTFGDYSWGSPEYIDHIQPDVYLNLIQDIDYDLNDQFNPNNHLRHILPDQLQRIFNDGKGRFMYWVFGWSVKEDPELLKAQFKDVERVLDSTKQAELKQRLNRTVSVIKHWKEQKWPVNPDIDLCKDCALSRFKPGGTCMEAINSNKV